MNIKSNLSDVRSCCSVKYNHNLLVLMSYLRTRLCSCDTRSLLYQVLYCTVLYFTVLYCTLMYQLTALLLMSVMGFGSYFCYDRCPSSAATYAE